MPHVQSIAFSCCSYISPFSDPFLAEHFKSKPKTLHYCGKLIYAAGWRARKTYTNPDGGELTASTQALVPAAALWVIVPVCVWVSVWGLCRCSGLSAMCVLHVGCVAFMYERLSSCICVLHSVAFSLEWNQLWKMGGGHEAPVVMLQQSDARRPFRFTRLCFLPPAHLAAVKAPQPTVLPAAHWCQTDMW